MTNVIQFKPKPPEPEPPPKPDGHVVSAADLLYGVAMARHVGDAESAEFLWNLLVEVFYIDENYFLKLDSDMHRRYRRYVDILDPECKNLFRDTLDSLFG